jgi:glycosyltransferase involved in cell wall biosynthesis
MTSATSQAGPPGPAPSVSVILPTHNRAALLRRSLGSVLGQTFRDLEVLVVDDGSTEDIPAVVAGFGDARTRVLRLPERRGGGGARNAGIAAARGRLVAFQDSDDEWLPDKLQRQVAALDRAGPGVGVAYCGFLREKDGGQTRYPLPGEPRLEGDLRRELLERNFITTAAALVRAPVLAAVGGFDPAMPRYQDWDLWARVAQVTRFAFLDEALLLQYHQPDSISQDGAARLEARLRFLAKHRGAMRRHRGVLAQQCAQVAQLLDDAGRHREARRLWLESFLRAPRRLDRLGKALRRA